MKKRAGSNIYNSVLELKNIKEYFQDPVAKYEEAKDHTLAAGKQRLECKGATTWMEILSHGGLRMPPQGDIREKTPQEFWKKRTRCWRNSEKLCFLKEISR